MFMLSIIVVMIISMAILMLMETNHMLMKTSWELQKLGAGNSNQQLANTELVSNPHSNDASSKKNSQIVYKYKMLHICLLFQFITLSFCMRENVDNVKKSEDEGCDGAEKKVPLILIMLEYICLFNWQLINLFLIIVITQAIKKRDGEMYNKKNSRMTKKMVLYSVLYGISHNCLP